MPYLRFAALLSLIVLSGASLYFGRHTDFAIFYVGALLFSQLGGKKS